VLTGDPEEFIGQIEQHRRIFTSSPRRLRLRQV
jgi:hypothetical protein